MIPRFETSGSGKMKLALVVKRANSFHYIDVFLSIQVRVYRKLEQ